MPASEWRGDLSYQFIIQVSYDALKFYGENEDVVDISIPETTAEMAMSRRRERFQHC